MKPSTGRGVVSFSVLAVLTGAAWQVNERYPLPAFILVPLTICLSGAWLWLVAGDALQRVLLAWRRGNPLALVVGVVVVSAILGALFGVLFLKWLLPPRPAAVLAVPRVASHVTPRIRSAVENLIFEIKAVAGRSERTTCLQSTQPGTQLSAERRMALLLLKEGKVAPGIVLTRLAEAIKGFEQSGIFTPAPQGGNTVISEYWPVATAYSNLLMKDWLLVSERYQDGMPLIDNDWSRFCVHGVVALADDFALEELKAATNRAEAAASALASVTLPSTTDLGELHRRLQRAGVPVTGLNEQDSQSAATDAGPTAYFMNRAGIGVVRVTLSRQITEQEHQRAASVIQRFESDAWWRNLISR